MPQTWFDQGEAASAALGTGDNCGFNGRIGGDDGAGTVAGGLSAGGMLRGAGNVTDGTFGIGNGCEEACQTRPPASPVRVACGRGEDDIGIVTGGKEAGAEGDWKTSPVAAGTSVLAGAVTPADGIAVTFPAGAAAGFHDNS